MSNNIVTANQCELEITLPSNLFGAEQSFSVTDLAAEGSAVKYGYVDANNINLKEAIDGTAEAFTNLKNTRFVEFRVTPFGDTSIRMTKFLMEKQNNFASSIFKDKIKGIKLFSQKVAVQEIPDSDVASDPDYETYRLLFLSPVVTPIE